MTKELLFRVTKKDFIETHIRGSGPGGQHRNKTSTGVRLVHRDSGATGQATDSKSQDDNRRAAWKRLRETPEWTAWFRMMTAETMGRPSIEQLVDEAMKEANIVTEVLDDRQRWQEVDPAGLT